MERRVFFNDDVYRKRVYSFIGDDRTELKKVKVGSNASVLVKDEHGKPIEIPFRVTRNAHLNDSTRWIYGKILDEPNNMYLQLELKIHDGNPEDDTAEAFPRAPSLQVPSIASIKKSRQ